MPQPDPRLAEIEFLTRLLDERFRIPGTSMRIGLDGIIGLIPGVGDAATTMASLYILYRARRLGVPAGALARMAVNILIDAGVGTIPVVGDLFDIGFKANRRNLELVRRSLAEPSRAPAGRQATAATRMPRGRT